MIGIVSDWKQFVEDASWFVSPGESAVVGESQTWSRGPVADLPELSALLRTAAVTPVSVGGRDYDLLAWGPSDHRRGWLCRAPVSAQVEGIHAVHQRLWSVCGGIVERFGEPESWWSNQNEVLTESAARLPLAPLLDDYSWLWRDNELEIPIEPEDYYVVAVEANGNLSLAHRASGQLIMFAPDHAFDGVTPLPNCPPYSLMTIDALPSLEAWIESCATAWSD